MLYDNPLNIIADKNWEDLSPANLTKWRKELLLRFDLEGTTTININGREYDKNTILETFEILKKEGDFHIELAKNELLHNFLKDGDTKLFRSDSLSQLFKNPRLVAKIAPFFQEKLSKIIYQNVYAPNFHLLKKLRDIKKAESKIPTFILEPALAKTYTFLRSKLREAERKFKNPLSEKNPKYLKPGLEEYVNTSFLNAMKLLPNSFAGIQFQWATFAHSIIYAVFHKPRRVDKLPRKTLVTLEAVAEFELAFRPDQSVASILKDIKAVLSGRAYSGNDGCTSVAKIPFFIIFLLIFLFRLGLVADGCGKSSSSYYDYRFNQNNNQNYDDLFKDLNNRLTQQFDTEKLIGIWKNEKGLSSGATFTETFTFYNATTGNIKLELKAADGNQICVFSKPFSWKIENAQFEMNFWEFEKLNCQEKQWNKQDLEKIKSWEKQFERGNYQTTFIFHGMSSHAQKPQRINIGVKYYDFVKEVDSTIQEDFKGIGKTAEKSIKKMADAEGILKTLREKAKFGINHNNNYPIEYDLKREQFYCRYLSSKLYFVSTEKRGKVNYFKPIRWGNYDKNRYFGYLPTVQYLDKNRQAKIGDLYLFFNNDYSQLLVSDEKLPNS